MSMVLLRRTATILPSPTAPSCGWTATRSTAPSCSSGDQYFKGCLRYRDFPCEGRDRVMTCLFGDLLNLMLSWVAIYFRLCRLRTKICRNSTFSDYKDQICEPWWSHHLVRKLVLFVLAQWSLVQASCRAFEFVFVHWNCRSQVPPLLTVELICRALTSSLIAILARLLNY